MTKKTPSHTARGRGRLVLITVLVVLAVLLSAAAAGVVLAGRYDKVYPNVSLGGVALGGMTVDEAAQTLRDAGFGEVPEGSVTAELPAGVELTLSADEVCTAEPETLAKRAYDAPRGGSAAENALGYLRCALGGGLKLDAEAAFTVDETAIRAAVDAAAQEARLSLLENELRIGEDSITVVKGAQGVTIDCDALAARIAAAFREQDYGAFRYEAEIEPDAALDLQGVYDTVYAERADAYYDPETGEIVPETVGVSFDVAAAQRLWDAAGYGETVEIPLELDEPEVTAAELEELLFRDKLSESTTSLWGSGAGRINNVRLAAEAIDGIVLMPGDEFSYNTALGKRTPERGYMLAGAYSGGETVQEYGGGICQVSSEVYYCALYANLKITARTCHMFPVGYLPAGLDATVSWGGPEFKFVNDREYPVRIRAYMAENNASVTVEFWGTDTDGSYVEMTANTWFFFDKKWTDVKLGYKAQTYRSVYSADGTLLSRTAEELSTYNYHEEDIEWPPEALEPEETPVPSETPTPTETPQPTEPPAETPTPDPTEPPAETETPVPAETPVPTEPADAPQE